MVKFTITDKNEKTKESSAKKFQKSAKNRKKNYQETFKKPFYRNS
jgi:hypothetical protein